MILYTNFQLFQYFISIFYKMILYPTICSKDLEQLLYLVVMVTRKSKIWLILEQLDLTSISPAEFLLQELINSVATIRQAHLVQTFVGHQYILAVFTWRNDKVKRKLSSINIIAMQSITKISFD